MENSLLMKNQTINSREIAEMVEMNHKELLRKLEGGVDRKGYIEILGKYQMAPTDYFIKSTYFSEQNKEMPCYLFTKMGCEFIANKFTGEKGILFTAKYVKRFNEMEQSNLAELTGLSPQLQLLISMELKQKQQDLLIEDTRQQVEEAKKEVQNIRDAIIINPKAEWREATNKILNNIGNKIGDYQSPRNEAYETLKVKGACRPKILVENLKSRALKNGMSKSKIDKLCILDVLENEPRLREIYIGIVKEMAVKNGQAI